MLRNICVKINTVQVFLKFRIAFQILMTKLFISGPVEKCFLIALYAHFTILKFAEKSVRANFSNSDC